MRCVKRTGKGDAAVSREKNLAKNTAILALGQLSSKVFTFFLLPVYTSLLTPEDFGTIDALQTIISLVLYFATLQIENAVFRFLIENRTNEKNQRSYVTSGLLVLLVMAGMSLSIIIIVNFVYIIPYVELFVLSLWTQSLYLYVSNLARGLGKNVDYSIASFIVTASSLIINIVLIVGFKVGASSILVALVFSNFVGFIYISCRLGIWRLIKIEAVDKKKIYEMLRYSLPLIPNAISWWIANTSDRLFIIYFLGASFNGIYAAANKIPTIYTTIFTVFNTAWAESVSLAIKDADRNEYIDSMINNGFKLFSFINMGIITCVSISFKWLIGNQYAEAYNHVFILLVAIFINSMCSLFGGVLGGLKNTKVIGWTTVAGAIVNALINVAFIRNIGLYAASISTFVSYLVIYVVRFYTVKKEIPIKLSGRYLLQCIIMLIFVSIGYFVRAAAVNVVIMSVLIIWGGYQNQNILLPILYSIRSKMERE